MVPPVTIVALALLDRQGLAGEHGFVHGGVAVDDLAVHRDTLAGTHAYSIVQTDIGDRQVNLPAVSDHPRGLGLQPDEPLDRLRGLAAAAHLKRGAERNEADEHGGGIEIGMPGEAGHGVGGDGDRHGVEPGGARP